MPTIPIDDGELWYEETGSGQPLVCLHGGWQDHNSWKPQVECFAEDYRVITFDFRGHGRTGPTDTREYSIELFTDDFETLLSTLDIERPLLAGISIGGMVIQSYLNRHPDAARGAVIGGPLQSMSGLDMPDSTKQMFSPLPLLSGVLASVGPKTTYKTLLDSVNAANGGQWLTLDDAVREQAMAALDSFTSAEFRKVFQAAYDFSPPSLSDVSTPMLVLYGDHDTPTIKQQGSKLARSVTSGDYQEIVNSGHLVNQDQPAVFNDACSEFFGTLGVPTPEVAND